MYIYNLLCAITIILSIKTTYQLDFVVMRQGRLSKSISKREISGNPPTVEEFVVKANVANRFAVSTILSKVKNTETSARQTAFTVVLPEKAFISSFSMEIDGVTYSGFVKDKDEAKAIYGQTVTSGQTAAHVAVSTRNSNRFIINVNVEPQSEVDFYLTYEELLQRENGQYEIVANIQPGQIVKKLAVEVTIKESKPLKFVRTPFLRSGSSSLPSSNADLDPRSKIKISNTSATVYFSANVQRQAEFACAGLGNKEYSGFAGQFVVQYDVERDTQGGETLYQDGFFINFFAPTNLDPLPKHVVFVLDTSGSMSGVKIVQLKDAMLNILPQLNSEDLFSIVQFASNVYLWDLQLNSYNVLPSSPTYGNIAAQIKDGNFPDAEQATEENVEIAKTIVNKFSDDGGTDALGGLEVGLHLIHRIQEKFINQYQPILVFLTDGYPNQATSEIISTITKINSDEYKAPLYSISFGDDADWNFLRELSLQNEGQPTRIHIDKDASVQLQDFYKRISTPILSNITFGNLPPSAEITKFNFPVLFNGSEITIAGKGISGNGSAPITVTAKGKQGPLELEAKIGIPLTRLERVWAYLTVKQILDQIYATSSESAKTKLKELALKIALKYSLVTDITSLVVVKPNDVNNTVIVEDASQGTVPVAPKELPMCNNITDWIVTNFGTPEPETTTTEATTTELPTTTTEPPTTTEVTTTELPTTTEVTTTELPTTTEVTTTSKPPTTTTTKRVTTTSKPPTTTTKKVTTTSKPPTTTTKKVTTTSKPPTTTTKKVTTTSKPPTTTTKKVTTTSKPPTTTTKKVTTTSKPPTTKKVTTTTQRSTTELTTEKVVTTEESIDLVESEFGVQLATQPPTTTLTPVTTKKAKTCKKSMYGCCYDGVSSAAGPNYMGCDPIPKSESCVLPEDSGNCSKYVPKWTYNAKLGQCRQFWYGGCGGNGNRFGIKSDCEKVCLNITGETRCKLPLSYGTCGRYNLQWYFDAKNGECVKFMYGGCLGNSNRFSSKQECLQVCRRLVKKTSLPSSQDSCSLPKDSGTCRRFAINYYFDTKQGLCRKFWYGGCGGNDNRFTKQAECEKICVHPEGQAVCQLPPIKGPCAGSYPQWYFDKDKNDCREFIYGGCAGNKNKYAAKEECQKKCMGASTVNLQDACFLKKDAGACSNYTLKWTFNRKNGRCMQFWYGGCGGNQNRFASEEKCKNICINPSGKDRCNLPKIPGPCKGNYTRWFFNKKKKGCRKFTYGGCLGNSNNFENERDCISTCVKP